MKMWITSVMSAVVVAVALPAAAAQSLSGPDGFDRPITAADASHDLTGSHVRVAGPTRRRPVNRPPAAIETAAIQAAQSAMNAGVPAVQIAVSQRGRIIYSAAFGLTDKPSGTAATPRSVMQIGSVTKQFTAAAILRLAERGKLALDDRIDKFVPEFDPRGRTITLRQLLTHTSGVRRDWMPPPPNGGVDLHKPTTRAIAISTLNAQPFDFLPGTKWSYSNAGYMLLGYAIESIAGESFADFMHREFALPLGLLDTGVCGTNNLPMPAGYGLIQTPAASWLRLVPLHSTVVLSSGSFCSTASDLALWSHLLAKGHALSPTSYATMTTPGRLDNNGALPTNYALGVALQSMLGRPAVWHGGAIDGYQSFLLYLSEEDIAIAVITNGFPAPSAGNPQLIAMAVGEAALQSQ